jgi:alpha-galactosidase
MGWNSWNAYSCAVTADDIRATADAMIEGGFRDAGYEYLVVDDCWMADEADDAGNLRPHPTDFPEGIEPVAGYVHDHGLKFGLYSSAGTHTCQGYPASLGREHRHAAQFADLGVDYLKYDNCGDHNGRDPIERYGAMGQALRDVDRDIVYSICEWGSHEPWQWGRNVGGHLWRTTDDVIAKWRADSDEFGLGIMDIIDRTADLGIESFHGPCGWNDPDMLQVGNGPGSGQSQHEPTNIHRPLSTAENRTQFAFWCLLGAPLFLGTDITDCSETVRDILTNERLIAINQDLLGIQGTPDRRGREEVWSKRLADGGAAVALLNRGEEPVTIHTDVSTVDLPETQAKQYEVVNCWTGREDETTGTLTATVDPRDTELLRVRPLD